MERETIIALDFASGKEALNFLDIFQDEEEKPFVKIGMELFYAEGPEIVREIKRRGHKIFLDLKLHDIPNTVGKTMKVLSDLDVDIVNLHAAGGRRMMEEALKGLQREDGSRPLLIAVTQLTSTSPEMLHEQLLIPASIEETIVSYAKNARQSGLDGVVCSPLESGMVKEACGEDFLTVTPGVRFADSSKDDQVRITTPAKARELGSDFIVVGRPITQSNDPVSAYKYCQSEFKG
ncbi:MAG: orotidine-5'-phosphate decarboxylase [Muribaculaceae bacterium]|nr:orotidine-5'-phosphate decarboxylase [Muribaculaceae bacterium]